MFRTAKTNSTRRSPLVTTAALLLTLTLAAPSFAANSSARHGKGDSVVTSFLSWLLGQGDASFDNGSIVP